MASGCKRQPNPQRGSHRAHLQQYSSHKKKQDDLSPLGIIVAYHSLGCSWNPVSTSYLPQLIQSHSCYVLVFKMQLVLEEMILNLVWK